MANRGPFLTDAEAKKITSLVRALHKLREVYSEMPVSQAIVLLSAAASKEPPSLTDICKRNDLALSTVSRALHAMTGRKVADRQAEIQPMIEYFNNPANLREKLVEFTPAGRKLVRNIVEGM